MRRRHRNHMKMIDRVATVMAAIVICFAIVVCPEDAHSQEDEELAKDVGLTLFEKQKFDSIKDAKTCSDTFKIVWFLSLEKGVHEFWLGKYGENDESEYAIEVIDEAIELAIEKEKEMGCAKNKNALE